MSERFEVLFYGDVINCVRDETGKEYNLHELIDILMDQQATIRKLQDLCGKSDGENAKLRIENKKLKAENEQLRQTIKDYEYQIKKGYTDLTYEEMLEKECENDE